MTQVQVVKKNGADIGQQGNAGRNKAISTKSEQKKIISKFGILFAIIIIITICGSKVYGYRTNNIKQDIKNKQRELQQVRMDLNNIKNVVNEWSRLQMEVNKTTFNDKRAFVHDNIRLDEIVFEVDRKINDQFDQSKIFKEKDKEKRMIAGNFHIDIQPSTYSNLVELDTFINKMSINKQNDVYVLSNNISISFTTSYEKVIYQMIEYMKNIFPGFLIVKSISVNPTTSAIKTMYYDLKFKHKDITELVVNSVRCEIVFDWIVLSKKNNENEM